MALLLHFDSGTVNSHIPDRQKKNTLFTATKEKKYFFYSDILTGQKKY